MPIKWIFQHDNDPSHTALYVKDWIRCNGIELLDWPPQYPDLNPIENLFGILKRLVAGQRYKNKSELFETLKEEWLKKPQSTICNLISSMPRRCVEVFKNKGSYTKY